jgi:hypothetical protein
MMVQATVPVAFGLMFTPWRYGSILISAAVCTIAAISYQLFVIRGQRFTPRWLASVIVFYGVFIGSLLVLIPLGIS